MSLLKDHPIHIEVPGAKLYLLSCPKCLGNNVDEDDRQAILKCSHCGTILARRDRHSEKFYQGGSRGGGIH